MFFEDDKDVHSSDITGVWVVSEDDTALAEAKSLAHRYFRHAKEENVVQIAGPALPDDLPDEGDATDGPNESGDPIVS